MTKTRGQDATTIARIDHDEAMLLTAVESRRFAVQLASLGSADWLKPTDCPAWDVRALAAHVVGSAAAQASPREFVRQVWRGRPLRKQIGADYWWDGMNELQVRERAGLSVEDLRAEWTTRAERALRARTRMPRVITGLPLLDLPAPVGRQRLAYLFDVGFTRDTWMHRIDIAHATGRDLDVDGSHDGRLVADIVAEWATTHREPFELDLSGPAGGIYRAGSGGEHVQMDAIEFVRILAGRGSGTGILRHPLPL